MHNYFIAMLAATCPWLMHYVLLLQVIAAVKRVVGSPVAA